MVDKQSVRSTRLASVLPPSPDMLGGGARLCWRQAKAMAQPGELDNSTAPDVFPSGVRVVNHILWSEDSESYPVG